MTFRPRALFRGRVAPAWGVFFLGLLASGLLGWELYREAREIDQHRLKQMTRQILDALDTRVEKTEALLRHGQDYFSSIQVITPSAFGVWCHKHALEYNQRWVKGVAFYTNRERSDWFGTATDPYAPSKWKPEQWHAFEAAATNLWFHSVPAFNYPATAEFTWATNYQWHLPYQSPDRVLSPDNPVPENQTRTTQIESLVDSNGLPTPQAALLVSVYHPELEIFQNDLEETGKVLHRFYINWNFCRGLLVAPIDYAIMERGIWDETIPQEVGVEIFASKEPTLETWLNPTGAMPRALDPAFRPYLSKTATWRMFSRAWSVHVYTLPLFEAKSSKRLVWVATAGGVVMSLIGSLLIGVVLWARDNARQMAAQIEEARDALAAANAEREKLNHDLHDNVVQSLYGLQLGLGRSIECLESDPAGARKDISHARTELNTVICEIRSFITPERRDTRTGGLGSVLGSIARRAQLSTTAQIELSCEPEAVGALSAAQAVQLANITREALSNSLRHGKPSRVRIHLACDEQTVRLQIQDDGRGFDTAAVRSTGLGLSNMSTRAREIGATLQVESAEGRGAALTVIVPRRVDSSEAPGVTQS